MSTLLLGGNYSVLGISASPKKSDIIGSLTPRTLEAVQLEQNHMAITGPTGEVLRSKVYPYSPTRINELIEDSAFKPNRVFLGVKEPICSDEHIARSLKLLKGKAWVCNLMNIPFPHQVLNLLQEAGINYENAVKELKPAYSSWDELLSSIDPAWSSNTAPDVAAGRDPDNLAILEVRHPAKIHITKPSSERALKLALKSEELWNKNKEKTGVGAQLWKTEIRAFAKQIMLEAGNISSATRVEIEQLGDASIGQFVTNDPRSKKIYEEGIIILTNLFAGHEESEVRKVVPPWELYLKKGGGAIQTSSSFSRDLAAMRDGNKVQYEKQFILMAALARLLKIEDKVPEIMALERDTIALISKLSS